MSNDPEVGVEDDTDQPDRPARPPRRAGLMWVVAVVLAALTAGAVVFAVTTYRDHRQDDDAQADRQAAISVAEQFTLRLDSLNYKDVKGYQKRINSLLTPKMQSDFADSFKGFEQAFTAIQFSSKGTVKSAGISDIDSDSATVLVIHDVAVTSKGCVQPPYKRMTVDLRKIQGTWLVDDFQEGVPGCQG